MRQSQGHLKLVPYNPNDYSLGEVLNKEHGTISRDSQFISAALSLYFQWELHRSSIIYPGDPNLSNGLICQLDYDRDERMPTEIQIALENSGNITVFSEFKKITIRFEVFHTCYEFQANVLAVANTPESSPWSLIISIPDEVTIYKTRRLPRLQLDEESRKNLPEVYWITDPSTSKRTPLNILELGMKSIRASHSNEFCGKIGNKGWITIGELQIGTEIVRTESENTIFLLCFESSQDFGRYFDFYRTYAYPALRSKYDFTNDQGLQLYIKTNYFGKFTDPSAEDTLKDISLTWDKLKGGTHTTIADYFIVDDNNLPTGASSLALAFFDGNTPVWAFHQLCAFTKPDLLEHSGQLYAWRAEYLAARPESLSAIVWFDSKSRWLERIYVKFSSQSLGKTKLYPVHLYLCPFKKNEHNSFNLKNYEIGTLRRVSTQTSGFLAAAGPTYLNASQTLDAVVCLQEKPPMDQIKEVGTALANHLDSDVSYIRVTVPTGIKIDFSTSIAASDRLCTFPKSDLVDFLASIDHSIAITEKKLSNGR